MEVRESFALRPKTTMRIGGTARYFADLLSRADIEESIAFARKCKVPLLPLGSGSNTIFDDAEIQALVVQIKHEAVKIDGVRVTVGAGKNLAMLINELAEQGLDLSALTGIPGTIGGAIVGNAGQGHSGIWIDSFVESVTAYVEDEWRTFSKAECGFAYRESLFKHSIGPIVIFEVVLTIPFGDAKTIKNTVQTLLQKRIEAQPHLKTAGSCFKSVGNTPAWKLIDAAGLRGLKIGDVEISPKHANFLMNIGEGTFLNAVQVVEHVRAKVPEKLDVEMRFIQFDGTAKF